MNVEALTSQEMLIFVVGVVIAVLIIGLLFKSLIKFAIVVAMCVLIFGVGFGWLPQKMEEIKNGTTTPGEVVNELIPSNETLNEAGGVYNQVVNTVTDPVLHQTIWDTIVSLFNKIVTIFSGSPEPANNTVDNTVDNSLNNTVDVIENVDNSTNP